MNPPTDLAARLAALLHGAPNTSPSGMSAPAMPQPGALPTMPSLGPKMPVNPNTPPQGHALRAAQTPAAGGDLAALMARLRGPVGPSAA